MSYVSYCRVIWIGNEVFSFFFVSTADGRGGGGGACSAGRPASSLRQVRRPLPRLRTPFLAVSLESYPVSISWNFFSRDASSCWTAAVTQQGQKKKAFLLHRKSVGWCSDRWRQIKEKKSLTDSPRCWKVRFWHVDRPSSSIHISLTLKNVILRSRAPTLLLRRKRHPNMYMFAGSLALTLAIIKSMSSPLTVSSWQLTHT